MVMVYKTLCGRYWPGCQTFGLLCTLVMHANIAEGFGEQIETGAFDLERRTTDHIGVSKRSCF